MNKDKLALLVHQAHQDQMAHRDQEVRLDHEDSKEPEEKLVIKETKE